MATVYVTLSQAMGPNGAPVRRGAGRSETITSSGTAASGALQSQTGDIATIFCATAVYASVVGTASASTGHYIPAGIAVDIAFAESGKSVSVIDA